MNALLENSKEALPLTELSRSTKRILEEFKSGEKEKYVVMRNNMPEAVGEFNSEVQFLRCYNRH
jgi:hypothetical protein